MAIFSVKVFMLKKQIFVLDQGRLIQDSSAVNKCVNIIDHLEAID